MKTPIALPAGMQLKAAVLPDYARVLAPAALAFVAKLAREFEPRRRRKAAALGDLDEGRELFEAVHFSSGSIKRFLF